jgi:hypothetical protein
VRPERAWKQRSRERSACRLRSSSGAKSYAPLGECEERQAHNQERREEGGDSNKKHASASRRCWCSVCVPIPWAQRGSQSRVRNALGVAVGAEGLRAGKRSPRQGPLCRLVYASCLSCGCLVGVWEPSVVGWVSQSRCPSLPDRTVRLPGPG